jgi:predicted DNA-binding transcriptional regulator AlpA
MKPEPSPLLETKAAAQYLGLSPSTMAKKRLTGRDGPIFYKIGSRCLYRREDLDAWIAAHARRSTSDKG